jgi:hypothetical protein
MRNLIRGERIIALETISRNAGHTGAFSKRRRISWVSEAYVNTLHLNPMVTIFDVGLIHHYVHGTSRSDRNTIPNESRINRGRGGVSDLTYVTCEGVNATA